MKKIFAKTLMWVCRIIFWFWTMYTIATIIAPEKYFNLPATAFIDSSEFNIVVIGQIAIFLIVLIILFMLMMWATRWTHKLEKQKKPIISPTEISGPFILYLRTFKDDDTTEKAVSASSDPRSEEEYLMDVLSEIAPVYAIGNPLDKEMPLGATRLYVGEDEWQDTVKKLASKAVLVVLRLGDTNNFWWEVETTLKIVPPQKLLYVIPRLRSFTNIAVLYKYLIANNIDITGFDAVITKPRKGTISSFIYFDDQNKIKCSEVKIHRFSSFLISYDKVIRQSLIGLLQKYGITAPKIKIKKIRLLQLGIFLYLLIMAGGLYAQKKVEILKSTYSKDFITNCLIIPDFNNKYATESIQDFYYNAMKAFADGLILLDDESLFKYLELKNTILEDIPEPLRKYFFYEEISTAKKKLYSTDRVEYYLNICKKAVKLGFKNPDKAKEYISECSEISDEIVEEAWSQLLSEGYSPEDIDEMTEYEILSALPDSEIKGKIARYYYITWCYPNLKPEYDKIK